MMKTTVAIMCTLLLLQVLVELATAKPGYGRRNRKGGRYYGGRGRGHGYYGYHNGGYYDNSYKSDSSHWGYYNDRSDSSDTDSSKGGYRPYSFSYYSGGY